MVCIYGNYRFCIHFVFLSFFNSFSAGTVFRRHILNSFPELKGFMLTHPLQRHMAINMHWSNGLCLLGFIIWWWNYHLMACHTLNPSSVTLLTSLPAKCRRVGNQSEMCISWWLTVPLTWCGITGPLTNATPRIPPSHSSCFLPRRGQLLPP